MEISARTTARFGLSRSTLRRAGQIAALGFFLVSGLFALHWPMLTTCLGHVQATEGDTRINLYALEHTYRWLIGDPIHSQLWSPPVYFPQPWTGPATETHIGTAWLYWSSANPRRQLRYGISIVAPLGIRSSTSSLPRHGSAGDGESH